MSEAMKIPRVLIRDYFGAIGPKSFRCNLCKTVYQNSGNPSNLFDHLKRRHQAEFTKFIETMKDQSDSNAENAAEPPMADENIKYEDVNPNILARSSDSDIQLIHHEFLVGDVIAIEGQENVNLIEGEQIVYHVVSGGNEDVQKNAEFQQQDEPDPKLVRLPNARSEVWDHFGFVVNNDGQIMDKSKVVCRMCRSKFCYSGNTTNFYSHLKSMHPDVKLKFGMILSKNGASMKRSHSKMNHDDDDSISGQKQQELVYTDDITNAIVDFIVADCRPISVVKGEGFQRLLHLLAPGYSLPDKQKLAVAVRKKYDQMRQEADKYGLLELMQKSII